MILEKMTRNDVYINIDVIYKSMKIQTITVVGYYDHKNTGDEQ